MNSFLKLATKANNLRCLLAPVRNTISLSSVYHQRQLARNLWSLTSNRRNSDKFSFYDKKWAHSKLAAEQELVEFLTEEILAERKAQKSKTIPTELDGFKAQLNGAEVTLTKKTDAETIKISFNVNHSVDTDVEPDLNQNMDKPELGELKSRPDFKVEIVRGGTTLCFLCSFLGRENMEEGYNDHFGIDELSIYDGEWKASNYAVSGEVLDSYLYDLILNYLEEKGISNEFVEKLSDYSTAYEHSAYIGLLEGLSKFASGK